MSENKLATPFRNETASGEHKSMIESAYRNLRRDIIDGRLAPGEKLRVEHLKDDYGVGAGTLREALSLLVADALVVSQSQRGFRVAPISLADFEDITRNRVMLECEALRQSIALGDDAWEGEVAAAFHRLSRAEAKLSDGDARDEWEKRNRVFHEVLIAACPSRWLKHFLSILYHQAERYRRLSLYRSPILRDIHGEHTALFDAVLAHDAERATAILADHIGKTLTGLRNLPSELFWEGSALTA
ncbi:FCD domain-containing protein [Ferribacterium limneticum]|uniref:FCD domain-containing protein n=1 Tax=Ferribacterium limneticum TaxID=76259 RepID=UPI001CFBA725|nr:FCD domain-containing protein [Ferribacterium limneticum]UCV17812.1 FCD domain-containing protein [Ferribacterium limneticum]